MHHQESQDGGKVEKDIFHTEVDVEELTESEIEYYVDNYRPYDKAGAYGVQEWFGLASIGTIRGSFYNVMGLPVSKLYSALKSFD